MLADKISNLLLVHRDYFVINVVVSKGILHCAARTYYWYLLHIN